MDISIHNLSPLIYIFFVDFIKNIKPIPDSLKMKKIRLIYNVYMSFLSAWMLYGIIVGTYETSKFSSIYNFICKDYGYNYMIEAFTKLFLYSKYIEYLDTLFLVLSGKSISWLQYTHHASTAILVYNNMNTTIIPQVSLFIMMNCFVHIPMYWYFAYPRGLLYPVRQFITMIQIIQHIIAVTVISITPYIENCKYNYIGNRLGLLLYGVYLTFFIVFYMKKYIERKIK